MPSNAYKEASISIYGGYTGNQGSKNMRGHDYEERITIRCLACGKEQELSPRLMVCSYCGGPLEIEPDVSRISISDFLKIRSMWRYRPVLPMGDFVEPITLGEGATPLIRLRNIERILGIKELYAKIEGANPTGSFKDRGMSLAVSIANSYGYPEFIVASTGNTAASASAYGARAGKRVTVVLPRGYVADGKLFQSILHGARILYVDGSFDDALSKVIDDLSRSSTLYPLNSINPWRLEGQKTVAYEIAEDLRELDAIFLPVGNGGNIYAVYKGFAEAIKMGIMNRMPRIFGVQAKGASPIYTGWNLGGRDLKPVNRPETIATAIRIGRPANWLKAFKAVRESKGFFLSVDDTDILASQRMLAKLEGVGCEPASAASLAGLIKLVDEGIIDKDQRIVIILTGHSLKDPIAR
ncbi:threonine synthase [Desulfurococcaceae archaeon AG1]|jgi:threonine synthase|nr:threonine synthase [Desulfurococcaceae archaeon AG1]